MEDVMSNTAYGRAALRKFGVVPEGFVVFQAEWLGETPRPSAHHARQGRAVQGQASRPRDDDEHDRDEGRDPGML